MRILSIGATGFIGKSTLEHLIQLGHEVIAFHRGERQPPSGTATEIHGDYRHLSVYREDLQSQAPDLVLHMTIANERQAADFMNTFHGFARRAVMLSSGDVYRAAGILHGTEPGEPDNAPITEDAPLRTQPQPYPPETIQTLQKLLPWAEPDYDKIPAERTVMGDSQLPGTVLRLPMVHGPRDPLHRLWPVVKRVADGRTVIPIAESIAQWRGPRGYVENVGVAIARAVVDERAAGRIYNIAEPDNFSELEWTRRIADAAGFEGEIRVLPDEHTPAHLKPPGNYRQHWPVDSSRIRQELGYEEPVSLAEALRRTIEWERANPPAVSIWKFDYDAEDAAIAATALA
jgi:nucleoside-diphosphate-sugar epimerase